MNIMNITVTANLWFILCLCLVCMLVGMLLNGRSGGHHR